MEVESPLLSVTAEEACDNVLAETVPTKTRHLATTPILEQFHLHAIRPAIGFGEKENSTLFKKFRSESMF